jgi:hypothetical protein
MHKRIAEAPHIKHPMNAEPHPDNRARFAHLRTTTTAPSAIAAAAAAARAAHATPLGRERPLNVYGAEVTEVGRHGVLEQIIVGQTVDGGKRSIRRTIYVHVASNESTAPFAARRPTMLAFNERGASALELVKDLQAVVDSGAVAGVYIEARLDAHSVSDWVTPPLPSPYHHQSDASEDDADDDDYYYDYDYNEEDEQDKDDEEGAADDAQFVRRVLATLRDLQARHIRGTAVNGLDLGQLVGFGVGEGGEFVMRLAKTTGLLKRVAVHGATLREGYSRPGALPVGRGARSTAVPALLLHGSQDPRYPYGGGSPRAADGEVGSATKHYLGVAATARLLASGRTPNTGCPEPGGGVVGGVAAEEAVLSPGVTRLRFVCPAAEAVVYQVTGASHRVAEAAVQGGVLQLVADYLGAVGGDGDKKKTKKKKNSDPHRRKIRDVDPDDERADRQSEAMSEVW